MLIRAEVRTLKVGDRTFSTPLVIPSFSSRAKPPDSVQEFVERTLDAIAGPVLVSAYDVGNIQGGPHGPLVDVLAAAAVSFVLLDSGGYEIWWNEQAVGARLIQPDSALPWSSEHYEELLRAWPSGLPLLAVSFDRKDTPLAEQIQAASAMAARFPQHTIEFLLKPPLGGFDMEELAANASTLVRFPVLGLTEKEIGGSMAERLSFINALRAMVDATGASTPIHVFGGLDPQMTPLYFAAGADIFDGLSWLRHAFWREAGVYDQAHVALHWPESSLSDELWMVRRRNIGYLTDLQIAMTKFIGSRSFAEFSLNAELLENGWLRCDGELSQ